MMLMLETWSKFSRSVTTPIVRKMEITVEFSGSLGHLCDVITHLKTIYSLICLGSMGGCTVACSTYVDMPKAW